MTRDEIYERLNAVFQDIFDNPTPEQLKTLTMNDVGIKLKDPDASKED